MARTRTTRRVFGAGGLLLAAMLFIVGAAFASAQGTETELPPPQQTDMELPTPQSREYLIQVDKIDVQVQQAPTGQGIVGVAIEGLVGDGCSRLERIEQNREGNWINIRIVGFNSGDPVCTMIAQTYRDNIPLSGAFDPGSYVVDVNGTVREFRVG
jgi:hypothetical protein